MTSPAAAAAEDRPRRSCVQPFVENEILRILLLGILTAAAISFLADAERKKVVGVFEVLSRRSARSAAWRTRSPCSGRPRSRASAC